MKFTVRDDEITPGGRNGFLDHVPIPWNYGMDITEIRPTGRAKVRIECRLPMGNDADKEADNGERSAERCQKL